jgi:tRNA (guanine37-N1)-methyltransferase
MEVPDTLLSGHHDHIDSWRQNQREKRTQMRRPDLWEKYKDKMKSMESEQ